MTKLELRPYPSLLSQSINIARTYLTLSQVLNYAPIFCQETRRIKTIFCQNVMSSLTGTYQGTIVLCFICLILRVSYKKTGEQCSIQNRVRQVLKIVLLQVALKQVLLSSYATQIGSVFSTIHVCVLALPVAQHSRV